MSQIICRDVSIGYDGHAVSKNINFSVDEGDYLCIVGENGSGKTTLMKTLLGLKSSFDGEIAFSEGITRSDIGYLPQQTEAQKDFPASVEEVVLSGFSGKRGLHLFYSRGEKRIAEGNMKQMGVFELVHRPYSALSGGQKQRVLLARALCATDKLLILDEPAASLDPKASEELYQMIYHLNRDHKITVLMVTHDIDAVVKYSTKVLHMGSECKIFDSVKAYKDSECFPKHMREVSE
ncbi:MAG: ABC transporter ATP-binding protein [Ruminococcaceae bacterium]|nr:ABC transporter ATP-binding protein [Oscillospiraceae bacterium]